MQTPRRLRGMEDLGPDAARLMARAGDALRAFLASYGYQHIDTPLLEETELLLRKSGGELASKMYTFTDPGGHRVSLHRAAVSNEAIDYIGVVVCPAPAPIVLREVLIEHLDPIPGGLSFALGGIALSMYCSGSATMLSRSLRPALIDVPSVR